MNNTLYLDMDGVVADFNAYVSNFFGRPTVAERWPDGDWARLREQIRMYRDLEKTPEADDLVDFCTDYAERNNLELLFLTAIPRGNDMHWAIQDKVFWACDHFPHIPVHFGPYSHDKQKHCKPSDILIDDRTVNIEEWTAVGGHGILHKGDLAATIARLTEIEKLL